MCLELIRVSKLRRYMFWHDSVGGGRAAQTYSSCAGHHWNQAALGTKWPNLELKTRSLRSKLFHEATPTERPLFPNHENPHIILAKPCAGPAHFRPKSSVSLSETQATDRNHRNRAVSKVVASLWRGGSVARTVVTAPFPFIFYLQYCRRSLDNTRCAAAPLRLFSCLNQRPISAALTEAYASLLDATCMLKFQGFYPHQVKISIQLQRCTRRETLNAMFKGIATQEETVKHFQAKIHLIVSLLVQLKENPNPSILQSFPWSVTILYKKRGCLITGSKFENKAKGVFDIVARSYPVLLKSSSHWTTVFMPTSHSTWVIDICSLPLLYNGGKVNN